jgi:membrane protein YqaA with SNARE-associated domain
MDAAAVGLWGLFTSAFLSATLLPGGSEAVLAYLVHADSHDWLILLAVASAGNTLGGMSSWLIGRLLPAGHFQDAKLHPAATRIRKHGSPVLLLSWLPVIGDPLCAAAGWLRVPWHRALLFIALGKIARYAVVLFVAREALL